MKELLQSKSNPNLQGPEKQTPLHIAARKGDFHIVQLLLENKALINCQG